MVVDLSKKSIIAPEILRTIYKYGPISRTELADKLNVSKSSVTLHGAQLLNLGICYETEDSTYEKVGRKPVLLDITPDYLYAINVVIEEETNYVVLSSLHREIISVCEFHTSIEATYEERFQYIRERILYCLERNALEISQIGLLAISAPGYFNKKVNRFYADGIFADWRIGDIATTIAQENHWNVYFENDLNAACWGEYCAAGRKYKNLLYVGGGLGIGVSMIISGELYYGFSGEAGEISTMQIWDEKRQSYVQLAERVSLKALMEMILREENPETMLKLQKLNNGRREVKYEDIGTLVKTGDPFVMEKIIEMAEVLARVLSNSVKLLNCEQVIVGGEFQKVSPAFMSTIRKCLESNLHSCPMVSPSRVDENATVYGLVQLSTERLIQVVADSL